MREINTVMEPFVWNYTQLRGTNFSRILQIDAALPDAIYECEIIGTKGSIKPLIKVISIIGNITTLKISLTAQQTAMMPPQSKWYFKITFKLESFVCWTGTFNLRQYI